MEVKVEFQAIFSSPRNLNDATCVISS